MIPLDAEVAATAGWQPHCNRGPGVTGATGATGACEMAGESGEKSQ